MRYLGLLVATVLLLFGCTIPTPMPSTTEMAMDDVPYEWAYQDSQIAWLIMNDKDYY